MPMPRPQRNRACPWTPRKRCADLRRGALGRTGREATSGDITRGAGGAGAGGQGNAHSVPNLSPSLPASSPRQTPLGEMNSLLQAGTHFDAAQLLDDDDRSNAPYPMWLDEFGSTTCSSPTTNRTTATATSATTTIIFSAISTLVTGNFIHPPAAVEGPSPLPTNKHPRVLLEVTRLTK